MTPIRFSNLSEKGDASVLIAGSGGMLGWELARYYRDKYGSERVHALSRSELDIGDSRSISQAFEKYRPSLVINAAAYTLVDKAEEERKAAETANAIGPGLLADACSARNLALVHYSTDQVFDGSLARPQSEDDPVNPLNWYAASKYDGEQRVLRWERSLVFRVQWLYGEKKDRFSPLRQKSVFSPFSDQYGAPTWTREIVAITDEMVSRNRLGLYHLSYDDHASWAEVFDFVKSRWNLSLELKPQSTASLNLPAKRPLFSVLSNKKLTLALGRSLGSWKKPLMEFLDRVSS